MSIQRHHWMVFVAAVTAATVLFLALSLREGIQQDLDRLLDRMAAEVLFVSSPKPFTKDDLDRLAQQHEIEGIAIQGSTSLRIHPDDEYTITWLPTSVNYVDVLSMPLVSGRSFDPADDRVAILGWEVKQVIFGDADAVGQMLDDVEIIGVLAQLPDDDFVREKHNRLVLTPIPVSTDSQSGSLYPNAVLFIQANGSALVAESVIMELLPGCTVVPVSTLYSWNSYQATVLNRVLLACGLGTALVATILVGGLLALSTLRRRREIGIRVATGARRVNVLGLVIWEGVLVALFGCLVGMGVGWAVTFALQRSVLVSVEHAMLPVGALLLGFVAALVPALQTARKTPVELLGRRGLLGTRNSARLIRIFVILAFGVTATAAILAVNIAAASHLYVDSLWGDIDGRTLLVRPPKESIMLAPELSLDDADLLAQIDGVSVVVPYVVGRLHPAGTGVAVGEGYLEIAPFRIVSGRDLLPDDFEPGVHRCLVSESTAESLQLTVGEEVAVRGTAFEIVGLISDRDIRRELAVDLLFPLHFEELLLAPYRVQFLARTAAGVDVPEVVADTGAAFAVRYPSRAAISAFPLNARVVDIASFFRSAIVRLGITTLILLLLAVFEANTHARFILSQRLHELGVRRCIGASPQRIALSAWRESAVLAAVGTSLGAICAYGISAYFMTWFYVLERPPVSVTIGSAVVILVLIAILGVFPVRSVMAMAPSDMLRKGRL